MISRIEGEILGTRDGAVELKCGPLTYLLLVPASDADALAGRVGRSAEFHTLHYLESQNQGAALAPRLLGFASADARAFFELLTTVKGLGARKALRALRMPYASIAEAIERRDVELLTTLPEIGRRTAEAIVAELSGKVDRFVEMKPAADSTGGVPQAMIREAVAALTRVGESRSAARRLVELALADVPGVASADELVAAAFRVRGGEGAATE